MHIIEPLNDLITQTPAAHTEYEFFLRPRFLVFVSNNHTGRIDFILQTSRPASEIIKHMLRRFQPPILSHTHSSPFWINVYVPIVLTLRALLLFKRSRFCYKHDCSSLPRYHHKTRGPSSQNPSRPSNLSPRQ